MERGPPRCISEEGFVEVVAAENDVEKRIRSKANAEISLHS